MTRFSKITNKKHGLGFDGAPPALAIFIEIIERIEQGFCDIKSLILRLLEAPQVSL